MKLAAVDAGVLAGLDQLLDLVAVVPIEVMLPIDAGDARVGEDVSVALHQLGVVAEGVELFLREAGVVVFDERDGLVFVQRDEGVLVAVFEVERGERAVLLVVD